MKGEDLFLAIGSVEEFRLARSELHVSSGNKQEEKYMKRKSARTMRNLLVAVMIISTLAVAAYAVGGLLIFDSPADMIAAIFGDHTGFDHVAGGDIINQQGDILIERPGFQRVPVDETVVVDDVVPYVDIVGQAVSSNGYTLTVDAFMYDEATKCGFVTYLLENPKGVSGYKLQANGQIWYPGGPDIVQINEYGYAHIIQDKTSDTCLAATYYFRDTGMHGDNLAISLPSEEKPRTNAEIDAIITELDAEIRRKLTPEEAIETAKNKIGAAVFQQGCDLPENTDMTQEEWDAERAYIILRDEWYHEEYEQKGPAINIPMMGESLNHATAANGAIVISPLSFQLKKTGLEKLLPNVSKKDMAEVSSLTILFEDGTEYVVLAERMDNTIFRLIDSATEGTEDVYDRYTCMFNRIIDVDKITAVMIDGKTIAVDE